MKSKKSCVRIKEVKILKILLNVLNICTTQRPGKRFPLCGYGATYHNYQ